MTALRLRVSLSKALLALVACVILTSASLAQERTLKGVALVIGQTNYAALPALPNPTNDARLISGLLGDLGFEVSTVLDADSVRLERTLRRFTEDAAGADVALLYFAGHGVEAGGENFLVPIDATPDAPKGLAAISPILAELQASVPVTILLLDACRTNPFPQGAMIAAEGGTPSPVSGVGLGALRGVVPFRSTGSAAATTETLGAVIGFAAEPGKAALDGNAGASSPYAAALAKHLPASGFAFGDVMTMVTEEVYLATGAQQLPWTNASLRRQLFFGLAPEDKAGDEALIRGERRKLLLTIAATPRETRNLVEQVAVNNGVPMDALYGMLEVLKVDTSSGPADIAEQLQAGAARLRAIVAERDLQIRQDPELMRLASLADRAEREGAVALALEFRARASGRATEIDKVIDDAEANVKARRLELAETFRDHAQTAALNFDFGIAAAQYRQASLQAERWDEEAAFMYRVFEADALTDLGKERGDNAALAKAVGVYEEAKAMPGVRTTTGGPASVLINQGIALMALAERENGTRWLEAAIAAYEDALRVYSRKRNPDIWATVTLNLGNSYDLMGERGGGVPYFKKALESHRSAQKVYSRKKAPDEWAGLQNNIGNSLVSLGGTGEISKYYAQSVQAFRGALEVWTLESNPQRWAMASANMANAMRRLGEQEKGTSNIAGAIAALRSVLEHVSRDKQPMYWAATQSNLGTALQSLALRTQVPSDFQAALAAFDSAGLEITRERDPLNWALIQSNIGRTLMQWAKQDNSIDRFAAARDACQRALSELRRDTSPLVWSSTNSVLGEILHNIGTLSADRRSLEEARKPMCSPGISTARRNTPSISRTSMPANWPRSTPNWRNRRSHPALNHKKLSGHSACFRPAREVPAASRVRWS